MDLHRREDGVLCYVLPNGQLQPLDQSLDQPIDQPKAIVNPEPEPESALPLLTEEELEQMSWVQIKELCEFHGYDDRPKGMSWKDYYLECM